MSVEEEQAVSMPSVRLQLEKVFVALLICIAHFFSRLRAGIAQRFSREHSSSSCASRRVLLCGRSGHSCCSGGAC